MGLRSARGVVFACAHGSRDNRCGVCGPVLIDKFKEEAELRGLTNQVFVTACSHIGGHKYAGNLIIYSPGSDGSITGHWYGYVTSDDVPELLDQHIGKGEIIERLWMFVHFWFCLPPSDEDFTGTEVSVIFFDCRLFLVLYDRLLI
ncbi:altered inheritance of mitochondria protein 32-like [Pyrus x bretschneideri]|uniref:altered inheritance of mitochondria protein 32-like n=1 Tax=Pyrus x bretschneideri TaxID=225117 RepID=UPI002030409F|nr:altered inheritance of mitochondria protein 32-like [Pyrus x bretschneideri]